MPEEYVETDEELLMRARAGDQGAWEQIVRRYTVLIDRISRRYRFCDSDAADVRQQVWIKLIEYADRLHTPAALPGWLATTANRVCIAITNHRRRQVSVDCTERWSDEGRQLAGQSMVSEEDVTNDLLHAERRRAVRRGLAELSTRQRDLLLLLVADPPIPYRQISRQTGMPIGSIGPTRARLINRLRDSAALQALTEPPVEAVRCLA